MSTVRVFMDDADFVDNLYGGMQWVHKTGQLQAFGGTLSVCNADKDDPPYVFASCFGLDLFIYGTMTKGVAGTYSLDSSSQQLPMVFSNSTIGKPGVELWRLTGLPIADFHIFEIKPTAGNMTIDYFTYTPLTGSNFLPGTNLIIDDQDPALGYSTGWVATAHEQYPQAVPYLGTTTGTNIVGSSMQLNFNGEGVAVYGALQQAPGILTVSFSVDNAKPTPYTPWDGTQTSTSDWFVARQMFNMSVPAGPHTLRISLQEVTGSQMLWLDSIFVQAAWTTTLSNVVGGSGSGSSVGTTGVGGISPVPTFGTTTPSFNTDTSSGSGLSRGAIGGLASGLFVLLAIVLLILRRCLARRNKPAPDPTPMTQVPVTPTTPVYTPPPPPPIPEVPASSSAPTTPPGPSLHETWSNLLNQQHDAQTLPLQTYWDTVDDVSSGPTQPSQQGSSTNLRNWSHHAGQPQV